jgi:hypothetical protein
MTVALRVGSWQTVLSAYNSSRCCRRQSGLLGRKRGMDWREEYQPKQGSEDEAMKAVREAE